MPRGSSSRFGVLTETLGGSLPHYPQRILFVSSTSVYGQNAGEWIDEESATEPRRFNGQAMLHAESLLRDYAHTHRRGLMIIRCSGIYGRGAMDVAATRLARRIATTGARHYANRIHVDDVVGVICHLLRRYRLSPQDVPTLLLASDSDPASGGEIAHYLGLAPPPENATTGKRCRNRRLLDCGYALRFASYRDYYPEGLMRSTDESLR